MSSSYNIKIWESEETNLKFITISLIWVFIIITIFSSIDAKWSAIDKLPLSTKSERNNQFWVELLNTKAMNIHCCIEYQQKTKVLIKKQQFIKQNRLIQTHKEKLAILNRLFIYFSFWSGNHSLLYNISLTISDQNDEVDVLQ